MNPDNDKPTTPAPSPSFSPPTPSSSTSAGDDAAMKAIDALESESNKLDGADALADTSTPGSASPESTTPAAPVINEPLTPSTPSEAPTASTLTDTPASDVPKPLDTEAANAAPAPVIGSAGTFQPFDQGKKKSSKKSLIILIIVLVVLVLGAGGYFGWQYLQGLNTPTPAATTPGETTLEDENEITDSEESVNATIDEIEASLQDVDDTEFADTTLSDSALYE